MDARFDQTASDGSLLGKKNGKGRAGRIAVGLARFRTAAANACPDAQRATHHRVGCRRGIVRDEMFSLLRNSMTSKESRRGVLPKTAASSYRRGEAAQRCMDASSPVRRSGEGLWKQTSGGPGKETALPSSPQVNGGFAAGGDQPVRPGRRGRLCPPDRTRTGSGREYAYAGGDHPGRADRGPKTGLLVVGKTKRAKILPGFFSQTIFRGRRRSRQEIAGRAYRRRRRPSPRGDGRSSSSPPNTGGFGTMAFDLVKIARK